MTVPAAEAWSRWPAPAKLNLFLQIVGRRPDGYHELQTVFQLLDWGDELALRPRRDGRIERVSGLQGVDVDADLTIRAARALQRATGCPLGADVSLSKQVPLGGGFGGGSSDAATVLVGLNFLWRTGLTVGELAAIGRELGADVPVFVHGRSAWAEGVGERLTPLELPSRWYLVVDTGVSVPTGELFQAPELTRDARSATIADFVSGKLRGNAFEPVLRRRAPAIAAALDRLAEVGEARLTGTGGGVFAAFVDRERALGAQSALPQGWRSWVVEGVDTSPLLRCLAMRESDRRGQAEAI
jgi:4-diphosphocytidyl-2-C-methyl-D-erythritol kinase